MDTKWTPAIDEDREYSTVADSRGDWIASCGPRNAHLIAAAPDMYEALEDAALALESAGLSCHRSFAALRKARGEA